MTKAEKMFINNRHECTKHIMAWGYETNPDGTAIGFNTIATNDFDHICTRTLNAVEKLVENDRKRNALNLKYGIIDDETYDLRIKALNMVEATVKNTRKALA